MKKQEEEWRYIKGFEEMYQISNLGRVKSFKNKKETILNNSKNNKGYYKIILRKNNKNYYKAIHQLIAIEFLNHTPNGNKLVVDHKNNVKTDNRLSNLQIITNRENSSKDRKNKTSKYTGVYCHKTRNKWKASIEINGSKVHLGLFTCELEAHNAYQNKLKEIKNEG